MEVVAVERHRRVSSETRKPWQDRELDDLTRLCGMLHDTEGEALVGNPSNNSHTGGHSKFGSWYALEPHHARDLNV